MEKWENFKFLPAQLSLRYFKLKYDMTHNIVISYMYLLLENFKLKSRVTKRDPSRSHFPDQFHAPTPLNARFLIEYKMTYIQFCICIYIYFMYLVCLLICQYDDHYNTRQWVMFSKSRQGNFQKLYAMVFFGLFPWMTCFLTISALILYIKMLYKSRLYANYG